MIAGPFLLVGIHDAGRRASERRLPRYPVPVGETNLQLRRVLQEGAGVDVVGLVDGIHHPDARVRVGHGQQPRRQIVLHRL